MQFNLEYIPSILKAKEQSISALISRISSQPDDGETQLILDTFDKIFAFDRFCANHDATVDFPPLTILSLTRDTKLVTNWLLTAMAVLPRAKRINNFLATTIAYLKPYSLLLAASTDIMGVKKLLNELKEKTRLNLHEQTFKILVKIAVQSFEGEKIAEFWDTWTSNAKDILLEKIDHSDISEYIALLNVIELSEEPSGIICGGLAFLFDLREALLDTDNMNTGITNFLRKVAIAQAFLGRFFDSIAMYSNFFLK